MYYDALPYISLLSGKSYRYDEDLIIPIIENTPFEADLEESMAQESSKVQAVTVTLVMMTSVKFKNALVN